MSNLLSIGEVIAELSEEFPGLTASKIRYLEAEGLLHPQRTARGSRRYAATDVAHLRRILRLQRDEFMPLAVIKERMDAPDSPDEAIGHAVPVRRLRPPRRRKMTSAEVAQRSGLDPAVLRELVTHGLVEDMDTDAVEVCKVIARLQEFGIEPRHLRSFRVAADREVGLVEQAMAPRRTGTPGAEDRELMAELLALLLDLHVALVRQRSSSLEP